MSNKSVHARLQTPTDLSSEAVPALSQELNALLANVFAMYVKTKNFHWHLSGPQFRDLHLLFDEQAQQVLDMTDEIAERVRKLGGGTIKSIGQIARLQQLKDNDADYVSPREMVKELLQDNRTLTAQLRRVHELCDQHGDVATASLIENWIDESERRVWFLFETAQE